jgi:RNA polymerase sigma factor (sigma-70 family)
MDEFIKNLQAARHGDPEAHRYLFNKFYGNLLRRATRYFYGDRDAGEELLASFLLSVVEKELLHKFRGTTILQLDAYLATCLRNFFPSHRKREFSIADQQVIDEAIFYTDPTITISHEETIKALTESLAHLKFQYRAVIQLEMRSYRHREISQILNLRINSVSSNSRRAKRVLEKLLRQKGITSISIV